MLVPGPEAQSSSEIMNQTPITISYQVDAYVVPRTGIRVITTRKSLDSHPEGLRQNQQLKTVRPANRKPS